MSKSLSTTAPAPIVTVEHGQAITTSIAVAEYFGKQHRNVLRAIESLLPQLPPHHLLSFEQGSYTRPETGEQQHKLYRIDRNGFVVLAMGFTGEKALAFKLAYLDAFNRMEAQLKGTGTALALPELNVKGYGGMIQFGGSAYRVHKLDGMEYLSAHDLGRLLSGGRSDKPSPTARRHVQRAYELMASQIPAPHVRVEPSPNTHDSQPQRLFSFPACLLIAQHCRLRHAQDFTAYLRTFQVQPKQATEEPETAALTMRDSGWFIQIDREGREHVRRVPISCHVATPEQFVERLADEEYFLTASPELLAKAIAVLSDRLGRRANYYKRAAEGKPVVHVLRTA